MTIYSSYRHLPPPPSLAGPLPAQPAQGEGVAPGAAWGRGTELIGPRHGFIRLHEE